MLLGGDEIGRTQRGNNNAYCQDNELSWFDWEHRDRDMLAFTRETLEDLPVEPRAAAALVLQRHARRRPPEGRHVGRARTAPR